MKGFFFLKVSKETNRKYGVMYIYVSEPHIASDGGFKIHHVTTMNSMLHVHVGSGERLAQSTELPVRDVQNCV